jgi:hypothetical protein
MTGFSVSFMSHQRCGVWVVACHTCGLRVGITAAGRPDDPRTVRLACNRG